MPALDDEKTITEQPLRRKISDICVDNVITTLPMDKISDVAKKMTQYKVSSVVVKAINDKPVGIITEQDMVRKVLSKDKPDLDLRAHQVMSANLATVRPDDFTYQALLMMVKHNISHVVVTSENDVLLGILTIRDLIKNRNSGALSIVRQIEKKNSFSELALVINEVDQVQQALLSERAYASELCALITELYDRITRRVIEIAEKSLLDEGWGSPPVKYCFINMGSAGRKEQFLRTDQDNGIIFEDSHEVKAELAANYFLALGKRIVAGLEECGFKRCPGDVMADNPRWCLPLSMWKNNIKRWVDTLDGKDIRNMTIFLDYRFVSGEENLCRELKFFTSRLFHEAKYALLFMAEDDLNHRVPMNIFGQIITSKKDGKRNVINLKSAVMVHMVDCVRLFALREGILETNTFERIRRLKDLSTFKPDDAEALETAYEALLMFRIKDGIEHLKKRLPPENTIAIDRLGKRDTARLKKALITVNHLQTLTAHTFHVHKA